MSKSKKGVKGFALVDICMPIYGEWALAEQALAAVPAAAEGLREGYRIIVVDNGTPDWTDKDGNVIEAKDQAEGIKDLLRVEDRFYRVNENLGYPGGVNYAVTRGQSPLVLVLTADVILQPGAITKMVRDLDDPKIGMVAPKLVFPEGTRSGPAETIQSAGMAFDIKGDPFHIFIAWSKDHPKANKRCTVGAATGACFMVRRSIWTDIGGMNEEYGGGSYEDMEFCFELRRRNYSILYEPEAWGYHHVGGSISHGANQGFNLQMNRLKFRGRWASMLAWDEWERW